MNRMVPPNADVSRPVQLPLFRFGLKQLLWTTALASIFLACIVSADGITATVILLASLVIVAHLFGTSLGSRLRARSDERYSWRGETSAPNIEEVPEECGLAELTIVRSASRSPWHGRGSTPLPWLRRLIVTGAVAGGVGGAILLSLTIGHRTSFSGVLLGSLSLGVLGGWFSFLGGSFYGIFRHGLRDALADQRGDQSGGRSAITHS